MTSPSSFQGAASRLPDFFTTEEGLAAGLRPRDLAAGVDFRQVFRGGYVKACTTPTYADEVSSALRVLPSAMFAAEHSAGRHHFDDLNQWHEDIVRREELEAMGWRFVIVTSSAMYADPLGVLRRIRDARVLAGAPDIRLYDGWRRHFG